MIISVIIVSWNAKLYLLDCLHSLSGNAASQHSMEIIVVDYASSDGSPEAVCQQFPDVRLIRNNDNFGFAKANNIGIGISHGEYICLINSDVVVKEGCFDNMIAYMDDHPEIGILGPRILDKHGNIQRSCMGFPTVWNTLSRALALDTLFPGSRLFGGQLMTFWAHDSIMPVDVINGCFWMVRRSALAQVGLLDERFFIYAEDVDWCKRFNETGWQVVFFPDSQAVHFGGASSANSPVRFILERYKADLQYWRKHHSLPARIAFFLSLWIHNMVRMAGEAVKYIVKPSHRKQAASNFERSLACLKWLARHGLSGWST